jgi:hypothetical protein
MNQIILASYEVLLSEQDNLQVLVLNGQDKDHAYLIVHKSSGTPRPSWKLSCKMDTLQYSGSVIDAGVGFGDRCS